MGAAKSKAVVDQRQSFLDEMVQKCGVTSCKNYTGPVKIHVSGDGTVRDMKITQQCQVDTACVFKAMSESISDLEAKAAAEAAAGLGVAVSDTDIRTSQDIQKKQEQDCGVTEADNYLESIDIGVGDQGTIENLNIDQIGNVQQQCMFEGLSDSYMKSKTESQASSTGLFGGTAGAFMLGIIILIVIGAVGYYYMSKQEALTQVFIPQKPSAPPYSRYRIRRRY